MKILYFGKLCDLDLFFTKEKKQQPYFVAQYMYENALYKELIKDKHIELEVISIYQTEYFPKDKFYFQKSDSELGFTYLPFINLPFIREFSYFLSTCYFILRWFIQNKKADLKCIYSSCHFPPVSAAIVMMSRVLQIANTVTFTDLPLFTYSSDRIKKMKIYKRAVIKPYLKLVNTLQQAYDNYVLFSEEMNKVVNKKGRPYLVIEGIYNGDNLNLEKKKKYPAIAHAGTLNREVGIAKILEVFNKIENQEVELWLMGKGDMESEIIKKSKKDKRIKYFGFLPREDVFNRLKEAKLLINLRDPKDEYTKHSFPSKMFEYMASGTPVFTTELKGIPTEYYQYTYSTDSYSSEDIKRTIEKIILTNKDEMKKKGIEAQKFILNKKNAFAQKTKIVDFLYKNIQK